jgi:hypothetical protein
MPSAVIGASHRQLTLPIDETILTAHRNVREVVAAGVYRRGLKRCAGELDLAPGNLSSALGDDSNRKFSVDELERYIQSTGDKSPVHYLVAKYLGDEGAARDQALGQVAELLQSLPQMLAAAGLPTTAKRR